MKPERAIFIAAFLGFLGLIVQQLGCLFGERLFKHYLGIALIALSIIFAIPRFRISNVNFRDCLLVIVLMGIIALFSSEDQFKELLQIPTRQYYYREKTAATFQMWLPALGMGFILSSISHHPSFLSGIRTAAITGGILALYVIIDNRHLFFAQDWEQKKMLFENELYSPLGLSSVLCYAAITLMYWRKMPLVLLLAPFLAGIIMVQQRSHILVLIGIALFVFVSGKFSPSRLMWPIYGATCALIAYPFLNIIVGSTVMYYWDELFTGSSTQVRVEAIEFAFHGFISNPIGNGYGSFSLDYPYELVYPHNLIFESAYELGLGGCLITVICSMMILKRFISTSLMAALAFFALMHLMKSSDMACANTLWFLLLISRPAYVRPVVFKNNPLAL